MNLKIILREERLQKKLKTVIKKNSTCEKKDETH